jgi:hypothetical protein
MEEIRLTYSEAFLYAMIPVLVGFVLGLIPLITGIVHKKVKLGLMGLVAATLGGLIFGMVLSIPAMAIFTWLILRDRHVADAPAKPEADQVEEDPIN